MGKIFQSSYTTSKSKSSRSRHSGANMSQSRYQIWLGPERHCKLHGEILNVQYIRNKRVIFQFQCVEIMLHYAQSKGRLVYNDVGNDACCNTPSAFKMSIQCVLNLFKVIILKFIHWQVRDPPINQTQKTTQAPATSIAAAVNYYNSCLQTNEHNTALQEHPFLL